MNISDLKNILEDIVHTTLYVNSILTKEQEKKLKEIKKHLKDSNNLIEDIRTLISTRNNENYFAYDKYIEEFLINASLDVKLDILNNQSKYEDIIKDDNIFIRLWDSINSKDKLKYLEKKKKYTSIDLLLINDSVNDNTFGNNIILKELLRNDDIRSKIDPFTINLNYSYTLLSLINLNDFEMCNILTKETYTKLLLKKYKTFNEFKALYEDNNKIYNLILNNSLLFSNADNEDIYNFILANPNFIGKFNNKYLELFSIVEITKISKLKTLDNDAFSAIIQKLYKYNNDDANKLFTEDNLRKCSKHSIVIYPFEHIKEDLRNNIFNTYTLFNRFIDTIMIEAINNSFVEEDIVNILRNDVFINDTSSYAIELLLNKLSFKSTFNMLQRKVIFNKINNLHVKVEQKDAIFFKGFLDSPVLVYKSEHNMIYEMLNMLDKEDVMYYISLPYIINNLSNYEIVNLAINKELKVIDIIESDELRNKLNITDIISLIDCHFEHNIDLDVFKNRTLSKEIFNLSDKQFDNINFDEVNYLFETIRMKSLLSKQFSKVTVFSYKSVLTSYLVLGLDETLKLVSEGNKDITLEEIKKLQTEVVSEKILIFKENNAAIFQNMAKKIITNLYEIEMTDDINLFAKRVRKNTYLDNIIYLMLDNNFDTYNGIIDKLYGYIKYFGYDEFASKKDMYEYTKRFTSLYLENKVKEYNAEFEKIILDNFKPRENVIYNKRKQIGKEWLDKLKLKLFVRALTDPNKESYQHCFKDDYSLSTIKDNYLSYLANEDVDFDSILEHVLMPIANDRFDKENCLNKLGINKPKNTDEYLKYLNDLKTVTSINMKLDSYKDKYDVSQIISIMNYLCYGTELNFEVSNKTLKEFNRCAKQVSLIDGEIYVDKSALKYIYKDNMDIYNIEEIIEYTNYLEILDDIIRKTNNYISKNMDNNKLKMFYSRDYFRAINTDDCVFPITNKYYEPKKRVLSINDIEHIFNGYDLSNYKKIDGTLKRFLFDEKNILMVADGYYKGVVDNLGVIISKWDKIVKYVEKMDEEIIDISLIKIENILTLINFEDNVFGRSIDKDIIKSIYHDGYYEVNDLNKRINILIDLYRDSFKRITSSIPYLCYKDDIYRVEILDNYKQDILRSIKGSLYKVGAIGNDFLHYSILNKNGLQLGIYKEDKLVAKVLGIRNGNTLYLNALEGLKDPAYNELLRLFANELIRITKNCTEPILYVTIVNNNVYSSRNGLKLDSTLCPVINDPINKVYLDFEVFCENKNLLNTEEIHTNYEDNISTLLASDSIVDKNNFKYYDAEDKYYRKRNNVIRLSNNIGEEYLSKIDTILYLCKLEGINTDINEISLSIVDTIYLGDDYVVFLTNKDAIVEYVLPYDDRAYKEVQMLVDAIKKELS